MKNYLKAGGSLSKETLLEVIRRVQIMFLQEPNLVRVEGKVCIVGDIHG